MYIEATSLFAQGSKIDKTDPGCMMYTAKLPYDELPLNEIVCLMKNTWELFGTFRCTFM